MVSPAAIRRRQVLKYITEHGNDVHASILLFGL